MTSRPTLGTANRTVLAWSGALGAAVVVWFISVGDRVASGELGSLGYVCAAVGMVLVIVDRR